MKRRVAGGLLLAFTFAVGGLTAIGLSRLLERRDSPPPESPPAPEPALPEPRRRVPKSKGILKDEPPPDISRFDTPVASPPKTLTGQVLDATGAPVPQAVLVWGRTSAPRALWHREKTNDVGAFAIPLDAEEIRVEAFVERDGVVVAAGASGSSWSRRAAERGGCRTTILVGPATVVRGVCVDPSGGPVPGARVALGGFETLPVTTDRDGRFEFPPLATANLRGFVAAWVPGEEVVFGEYDPRDAERPEIRLALDWRIDVRARILDERGEPLDRWYSAGGYAESGDDRSVAVWRGVRSPGRLSVSALDGDEPAEAEFAFSGGDPLLDLGTLRLAKPWPAHVRAFWSDGERIDVTQIHRKRPGATSLIPLAADEATGASVLQIGSGSAIVAIRAARRPDPLWGLPEGFLVTGTLDVTVAAGDDLTVKVEPDPVLVLRATGAGGGDASFGRGLRVSTGIDFGGGLPVTVSGGIAVLSLTGRAPWHLTVHLPGGATVPLDIHEMRPRIDRDIVLR